MRRIVATFVAMLVAAAVLTGCGGNTELFGAQGPLVEPSASASPSPSTSSAACEPQYVQVKGSHDNNRVIDDFQKRYAQATAKAHNVSGAQRSLLLKESARNAQVLAIWTHAFGLHKNPNSWKPLVADGCLSSEGIKLHAMFEGVLKAKGTKFAEADAPASGYNSGVAKGTFGVANTAGIRGDRTAIMVILPDGSVVFIMTRCGNVVYPNKAGLPVVRTDNPRPPKTRYNPPGGCKYNCNPPGDDKIWSRSPSNQWTPLTPGLKTDGQQTQRQKESGQTSGNVIDNKVPSGTKSNDTTPDLPAGTVTAPGATKNEGPNKKPVEDTTDDVVDEEVTVQDPGGTEGATCVEDPFTGKSNC